jgi:hypothetical protein
MMLRRPMIPAAVTLYSDSLDSMRPREIRNFDLHELFLNLGGARLRS